jgi:2-polyprenyl-6-methoxyphenol hydroxylase-like FAD-dependent oxidoreductase
MCQALIRSADVVYQYRWSIGMLPTWDFRRITLLGDAAHPMCPTGANGASQAIMMPVWRENCAVLS